MTDIIFGVAQFILNVIGVTVIVRAVRKLALAYVQSERENAALKAELRRLQERA